jgi:hypothetical protein
MALNARSCSCRREGNGRPSSGWSLGRRNQRAEYGIRASTNGHPLLAARRRLRLFVPVLAGPSGQLDCQLGGAERQFGRARVRRALVISTNRHPHRFPAMSAAAGCDTVLARFDRCGLAPSRRSGALRGLCRHSRGSRWRARSAGTSAATERKARARDPGRAALGARGRAGGSEKPRRADRVMMRVTILEEASRVQRRHSRRPPPQLRPRRDV